MTDVNTDVCAICQKRQDERFAIVNERMEANESETDSMRKDIANLKEHINEKFNKLYLLGGTTSLALIGNLIMEYLKKTH
ncbi:MAG: hypothetical protein HQK97_04630 [Nitrospirae bacterium]|nr:hypothetical protein [Nitrospirota bacterium]